MSESECVYVCVCVYNLHLHMLYGRLQSVQLIHNTTTAAAAVPCYTEYHNIKG